MLVIDMQVPAAPLLDIKEAADFLRVSETSLRRWTNAGRLPCVRIGGRQERRFRREDLEAFLSRASGVPSFTAAPRHLCGFYTSDLTRARDAAALLAAAPRTAGRMFLVAKAPVRRAVMSTLGREQLSRLVVAEYQRSVAAQVRYWREQMDRALREGVAHLTVVGDVSGGALGSLPVAQVLDYEGEYDRSIARRYPVTTLCLYDARSLSGLEVAGLLQRHDGHAATSYHA